MPAAEQAVIMNAKINGKTVLLNEAISFREGEVLEFSGRFPLRVTHDPQPGAKLSLSSDGSTFTLSVGGLTPERHSQFSNGSGHLADRTPFNWLVRADLIDNDHPKIYSLLFTVSEK
ncbi:hypothetical protein [Sphingomonas sanguinis]|uniref:hypothetical protein n=2 Tax=Sphingomonas sanguinis TaxID=33051 RepID=UPI003018A8A8